MLNQQFAQIQPELGKFDSCFAQNHQTFELVEYNQPIQLQNMLELEENIGLSLVLKIEKNTGRMYFIQTKVQVLTEVDRNFKKIQTIHYFDKKIVTNVKPKHMR